MPTESAYKVYPRRWYVLFIVIALNVSNMVIWCSDAPVANLAAQYYKVPLGDINTLSIVYFVCCFPFGILFLWFADYIGLSKAVWIGAWLNAVGSAIKALGNTELVSGSTIFNLALIGQIVAGMAQMFLYVPTKVADSWFPPNQRTLATSLIAMANPLGIMVGVGLIPLFVTEPKHIALMNLVSSGSAVVCALISCGVTTSKPPVSPSESAENTEHISFSKALKELSTNKPYLLLLVFGGAIIGFSGTLCTLLEEILTPHGYTNRFSGLCVFLIISFGIIGSAVSGIVLDRTKAFTPTAKVSGGLACALFSIYSILIGYPQLEYVIAFASIVMGIAGLVTFAVLLELSVECTYPLVPDTISTGILYIFGQLHGTVYFVLIETFATKITISGTVALDMTRSLLIMAGILATFSIIFIWFFNTEYKRTRKEVISRFQSLLSEPSHQVIIENSPPVSYGTNG